MNLGATALSDLASGIEQDPRPAELVGPDSLVDQIAHEFQRVVEELDRLDRA